MVPESYYVGLSAILFTIGVVGVVIRRNPLVMFMSIELMLNAANLALVAFGRRVGNADGQAAVLFVMAGRPAGLARGLPTLGAVVRLHRRTVERDRIPLRWRPERAKAAHEPQPQRTYV